MEEELFRAEGFVALLHLEAKAAFEVAGAVISVLRAPTPPETRRRLTVFVQGCVSALHAAECHTVVGLLSAGLQDANATEGGSSEEQLDS